VQGASGDAACQQRQLDRSREWTIFVAVVTQLSGLIRAPADDGVRVTRRPGVADGAGVRAAGGDLAIVLASGRTTSCPVPSWP
jgi:hypothetical protein